MRIFGFPFMPQKLWEFMWDMMGNCQYCHKLYFFRSNFRDLYQWHYCEFEWGWGNSDPRHCFEMQMSKILNSAQKYWKIAPTYRPQTYRNYRDDSPPPKKKTGDFGGMFSGMFFFNYWEFRKKYSSEYALRLNHSLGRPISGRLNRVK